MPKFSKISKEEFEKLIQERKIKPLDRGEEKIPLTVVPIPSRFHVWSNLEDKIDADSRQD